MTTHRKSHFHWSWTLFVLFFLMAVIDIRYAILGLLCMALPLYHALRGRGKIHCSLYCPRGSFLQRIVQRISLHNPLPPFLRSAYLKWTVFAVMMGVFALSLYDTGGDPYRIGMSILRLVAVSSAIAAAMGIVYKPRSWCTVCPMGHVTSMIRKSQRSPGK